MRFFLISSNVIRFTCLRDYGEVIFANSSLPQLHTRDLDRPPWCYLIWGAPAVLAVATSAAYQASVLSVTEAGIFWTLSVAWIGLGCFINARLCGRIHCMIDGILLPALSIVGVLNVFSVISISWSLFWIIFFVILLGSFIFEWSWRRYY